MRKLQDDFSAATGFAAAIVDPHGHVLARSGWSDLCAKFHLRSPVATALCRESDAQMVAEVARERKQIIRVCKNGLGFAATPILVEDRHVATLTVSQVFFNPPDHDYFREQAKRLEIDEEPYLAAVNRIRVIPMDEFRRIARYAANVASLISHLSQKNYKQKLLDDELRRERARFEAIFQGSGDAIRIIGTDFRIQDQNREMAEMSGVPRELAVGRRCSRSFHHPFCGDDQCILHRILSGEELVEVETEMTRSDGQKVFVELISTPLRDQNGTIVGVIESFRNIQARKYAENQLRYLSMHDPLTGLYNRAYFEEEMRRLDGNGRGPVSIIVADVDGLKIINDSLGHDQGDAFLRATAGVLRASLRSADCIARIGGDEFAVILPQTGKDVTEAICARIRDGVAAHNATKPLVPLSLSIGTATADENQSNVNDLFREADNNMYREKTLSRSSVRNATVQALMAALEARDFVTEGHADRLQHLAADLATACCGLNHFQLASIKLLAQFHDIGKVGVSDLILFKPGPLTPQEKQEMERHCEIGHRIALASPVLAPIADLILKHHEWWDGRGYPLNLKGDQIPLECRILAIVDAYDAMTSDRPYRQAMSREEAIQELRRFAGTQFDPELVECFVRLTQTGEDPD